MEAWLQRLPGAGPRAPRPLREAAARLARWSLALGCLALIAAPAAGQDGGVIRLGGARGSATAEQPAAPVSPFTGARRGFDYDGFEARLESLWFQRKAFLADGREEDASRQSEEIRAFSAAEGVRRLDVLAGALLAEAGRYLDEGRYARALDTIELAETFDPGRAETSFARAVVYWKSGRSYLQAAGEMARAFKRSLARGAENLTLVDELAVVLVVAMLGCVAIFSLLMLFRYQGPLRHEIEEWATHRDFGAWSGVVAWGVVLLPLVIWVGAGWVALYWILLTCRFMRGAERWTAAALIAATALAVPAYRVAVSVYGLAADPVVRTTLASAGGAYDPDRIVKLRQLVDNYPDDPIYRFLLAGLYKNGRYFEEAYEQYRHVLELDPSVYQASINVGNIFFITGQHAEATARYREALEAQPQSVLAYYNMHLAQSEAFHFKEAEASLARARQIDAKQTTEIMEASRRNGDQATVVDASVNLGAIWQAALEGRGLKQRMDFEPAQGALPSLLKQFLNPVSLVAAGVLLLFGIVGLSTRRANPARRCIRCGRPFCQYCKRGRQGHEYCSQCLHLFVIGDGLAPETKTRKLYEVERHERRTRGTRSLLSVLLPGAAHLLRGRAALGCALILLWLTAVVAWSPTLLRPLERVAGLDLRLELLHAGPVPPLFSLDPTGALALCAALVVWLSGNLWRWRGREA